MNVTILGAGAYGLALSKVFYRNGHNVTIWTTSSEKEKDLMKTRMNESSLPNYRIDEGINITFDMKEAIRDAKLIIVAIPIKYLNSTIMEVKKYYRGGHICVGSKGILEGKNVFPHSIISKTLKTTKVGVISGGSFATDIVSDVPVGLTIASKNRQTIKVIEKGIKHELLKVDITRDVIGCEMWGAIKNVVAIGCGMIYGMGYLESSRALFFTKCYKDITNLIYEFNGNKGTARLYSGIGDLFLTCTSTKSRNYTLGVMFGRRTPKDILDKHISETTIEGYYTLKTFHDLIHRKKVKSEFVDTLYAIVYENKDINILLDYLNS